MKLVEFNTFEELKTSVVDLLATVFNVSTDTPYAVLLPGGRTPLTIYNDIREAPLAVSPLLRLGVTDERYVPEESDDHNGAKIREMALSCGVAESDMLLVDTKQTIDDAAQGFSLALSEITSNGGRVELLLLGLGSDGHTASLFSDGDVQRAEGMYALPVSKAEGPDRISIGLKVLENAERTVILTAGSEKREIVDELLSNPLNYPAGMAVSKSENVELWFCETMGE